MLLVSAFARLLHLSCNWMCGLPILLRDGCWGAPFLYFIANLLLTIFVHFIYLYYACPSFKMSLGVYALWTHDVTSD